MHQQSRRRLFIALIAAMSLRSSAWTQDGPEFLFRFDGLCGRRVQGQPGEEHRARVDCVLSTRFNDTGVGAHAWSMAVRAENGEVFGIRAGGSAGLVTSDWIRRNTFERSELVGKRGAVSVVTVSPSRGVTLPADFSGPVASVWLRSSFEDLGEETTVTLAYVDGLRDSNNVAIDNTVTHQGRTVRPHVQSCSLTTVSNQFGCEPESTQLGMLFQRNGSNVESDQAFDDWLGNWTGRIQDPARMTIVSGEPTEVHVAIVSRLPESSGGVQGWSIGYSVQGDLELLEATVAGTAAARIDADPPGVAGFGFEKTEMVDPRFQSQGHGAVSAVVLSFTQPLTLKRVGTATVLKLVVQGVLGGASGQVLCDEEIVDSGQGASMLATVDGGSMSFDCCPVLDITLESPSYVLGDVNLDGQLDIADPIYFVGALFLGEDPPQCRAGSDFNEDQKLDLSDAISLVVYLFLGGDGPSAPFPECSNEVSADLDCAQSSASCL